MTGTILDTLYPYFHLILTSNAIHSQFIDEKSKAQRRTCLVRYCGPGMRTRSGNIKQM